MAELQWKSLPEDAEERRMFDRGTQLHGDVRLNIANMLRIFAAARDGGSYADQCRIMANEVAKLSLPAGVEENCKFPDTCTLKGKERSKCQFCSDAPGVKGGSDAP